MSAFPNNQSNPAGAIPVWLASQPVAVAPTVAFPATIDPGVTYDSGVIATGGQRSLVLAATLDQPGVLEIVRYADAAGNSPIDTVTNQFGQAGAQSVVVNDGVPFRAVRVRITNSGAAPANLSHAVLLAG